MISQEKSIQQKAHKIRGLTSNSESKYEQTILQPNYTVDFKIKVIADVAESRV